MTLFVLSLSHPGVLVAKVGYFGAKFAKVPQGQMGTKPAKVGHLAANLLKYVPKKIQKNRYPRVGSNPGRFEAFDLKAGIFPCRQKS